MKSYKVGEELCRRCKYRASESTFYIHKCDYAFVMEKCRLDAPGTCTHFVEDERYDEREYFLKLEEKKLKLAKYREEHKPIYTRPVGRPKKEW